MQPCLSDLSLFYSVKEEHFPFSILDLIFVIAPEIARCSLGVEAMTNIKSKMENGKWNSSFISYPADSSPRLRFRYTAAVGLHAQPDDERAQRTKCESG